MWRAVVFLSSECQQARVGVAKPIACVRRYRPFLEIIETILVFRLFRKTDDIYERRMTIYHMSHSWQVHVVTHWQPWQVANMLKRKCFKMTTPSAARDGNFVQMTTLSFQNGHHFADNIFRCIFVSEKFCILIKISLKFVPKGQIDNNPALVQIMAWRRPGDKPLSEPMLTRFTDAYMRH